MASFRRHRCDTCSILPVVQDCLFVNPAHILGKNSSDQRIQ